MSIFCTVSHADPATESGWADAQKKYYQQLRKQKNASPEAVQKLKKEIQDPAAVTLKKTDSTTPRKAPSESKGTLVEEAPPPPSELLPDAEKIEREITYGKPSNPKPLPSNRYQMLEVK